MSKPIIPALEQRLQHSLPERLLTVNDNTHSIPLHHAHAQARACA